MLCILVPPFVSECCETSYNSASFIDVGLKFGVLTAENHHQITTSCLRDSKIFLEPQIGLKLNLQEVIIGYASTTGKHLRLIKVWLRQPIVLRKHKNVYNSGDFKDV